MKLIADLKNFFTKSKAVKDSRISINRATAEEQQKVALARGNEFHVFGGCRDRNTQAIFIPRKTRFKGYMRENRKYRSFKKKAA
jgi:hypothetical protein